MKVIKRNGTEVPFDYTKIKNAIEAANACVAEKDRLSDTMVGFIVGNVEKRCDALGRAVSVEEIQDMVVDELDQSEHYKLARHYSDYRLRHELLRKQSSTEGPLQEPNDKIRCEACGCAFPPNIESHMDGEIEIIFFRCPYCGKGHPISVTDEALRNNIQKYSRLRDKKKRLSERMQKRLQKLKASNVKRCEELKKQYPIEEERTESDVGE